MKRNFSRSAALFLLSILSAACSEPLKEAQVIEGPRVLGVRTDVDGSSEVEPGEPMIVDLLLVDEGGPLDARVALRICRGTPSDRGVPSCSSAPFHEVVVSSTAFPLTIDVPAEVPRAERVVLQGAVCIGSDPFWDDDPLAWGCENGSNPLRFTFETRTASEEGTPNRNPDLNALAVRYDGVSIVPDEPGVVPACDPDVAELALDEEHELTLAWDDDTLESGEELQLSHFSTEGEFERAFSFVGEGETSMSLEFKASSSEGPLKQYVVARDGRGGVSWTSWTVCQR